MIAREELVHIGKITKSHGLNGELEINVNSELFEECETPYIVAETDPWRHWLQECLIILKTILPEEFSLHWQPM